MEKKESLSNRFSKENLMGITEKEWLDECRRKGLSEDEQRSLHKVFGTLHKNRMEVSV